ncbi:hypothetical protein PGQ11_011959 [Apiospora arundinis]|uniref:Cytochrome P450 monooxygenase n=1 Tax=Apiospora arundinis TaxID=335852 RepID=A0ABR2I1J1_9PEZI
MLFDQILDASRGGLAGLRSTSATAAFIVAISLALYLTTYPIYSLFLHPLSYVPGPKLSACTRIPYWIACIRGNQVRHMTKLHEKYGPVVRYGPNDLSYSDGRAWRDICLVPKGKKENPKESRFHGRPGKVFHIISEPTQERHAVLRNVFSPAFSEQALRRQEPMFRRYADLMVARGRQSAPSAVDMAKLLNFTTFDIMAELAFGESLGLLEANRYSDWLATTFELLRVLPIVQLIDFYPLSRKLFNLLEPPFARRIRLEHFNHTASRVDKRLERGPSPGKPDLWTLVENSEALTLDDMHSNAVLFMMAGTETSASLLTGLTYYLVTNPDKMKILTDEVRHAFPSSDSISFEGLAKLRYLNACIREGLRVYPSVPSAIPRVVAAGGNEILGKWIPGGTIVSVHHSATYRSPSNFRNPDLFAPERWLDDPDYADDNRDAHQPFSVGPRNCIGMNMAWHEMRLILAKLLYNFDLESDVGPDWRDQDVYVIWDRKPLMCRLKDASTASAT